MTDEDKKFYRHMRQNLLTILCCMTFGGGFLAGTLFTALDFSPVWIAPTLLAFTAGFWLMLRNK